MTLRRFAQEVEIANDRAVRERPREFRDQCEDTHVLFSIVILSEAKNLARIQARPFASLRVTAFRVYQYKPWYCAVGILVFFSAAARSTI